ncbi:MoxR family ATPase [Pseudokineococcus basanitobsidens]|uniref:MoxR family ATPase n=1 Tax=Pseudokineococcus basanitobsidens TaxID=1926649 RepID=A0ABU8RHB2_9ACTN
MTSTTAPPAAGGAGPQRRGPGPDGSPLAPPEPPSPAEAEEAGRTAGAVVDAVRSVVRGKDEVVRTAVTTLVAGGHLLVEDVPGVGKTVLASALARAVDLTMRRIQFTPDLLPSDVTGVSIWDPSERRFSFTPGAVFAGLVVADEINRASPKTQSALLECMAEGQVTVDGTTHLLPDPFFVVATQNPGDMEGTYPLPEAQRDRFTTRLSVGYPAPEDEVGVLVARAGGASRDPLAAVRPVAGADDVRRLVDLSSRVHAAPALVRYVVDLVGATRRHPAVLLGASPRAALHLLGAARARALVDGRPHVLPDDVQALCGPVLAHRLVTSDRVDVLADERAASAVVQDVLASTPLRGEDR